MPTPGGDPQFNLTEREDSQLAALDLLARIGYKILTREEALALRGGKPATPLLTDILRAQLPRINAITHRGKTHAYSPQNIRRAIQALEDVPRALGLQHASEQVYDLLRLGKSFDQTINGDTKSYTLRYVDWDQPDNNVFHATSEYRLLRTASHAECRLDVVCFVNGVPFVTIECKSSDTPLEEAIEQTIRYQSDDYIPEAFKFVQVTIAANRREAKYATTGATGDFWAVWKSRPEEDVDAEIAALRAVPLPSDEEAALLCNFVREQPHYYAVHAGEQQATEQDRALLGLCRPARLLEMTQRFVLYDGGIKKIARYQQYYAVKRAMARIVSEHARGARPGGVIWHTQGSGKSLTMVLLANAIALSPGIRSPRILLVTDRVDLDKQLKTTFERCGLDPRRATSGADLRRLVEKTRATVITTLVQKFDTALKTETFVDESADIFILVDESHRSQYGPTHTQMKRMFPNACYIGFTGTPLLKKDKSTVKTFGGLIDTYSIDRAVKDKVVVPLLYEARHVEQEVQQSSIDAWFARICQGLSSDEQEDLKRKYSQSERLTKTEQRLKMVAYDVSEHFRANWQDSAGRYKAQLVAPDKKSAVRLHRYLNDIGHVKSCVVISEPLDKEGEDTSEDANDANVSDFWRVEVKRFASPEKYEEDVISKFSSSEPPEILIVVDKLLTGFDVPRNTVLYLARRLTHHSLLQAVARVNRLYEGKDFGYIIDYVGVLGELNQALTEYRALEGYDEEELRGLLAPVQNEYRDLPQRHAALLAVFNPIANKNDTEACEQLLADQALREEFYESLNGFSRCLKVALSTEGFYDEAPTHLIERYQSDLRRIQKLRFSVQLRYAEVIDIKKYEPQIAKLLDTYVSSDSVTLLTSEPINIFDAVEMDLALESLGTPAAKADAVASAMERTLTERMNLDPALYRKFSEMLRETIQAFRDHMLSGVEYLKRVGEIREQVVSGAPRETVPAPLVGNDVASAYYRLLVEHSESIALKTDAPETTAEFALALDEAIRREIVVDWQNKVDVDNQIRANLDDLYYEWAQRGNISEDWAALDDLSANLLRVAKSRFP
jgi:type I restriction enzyme R subunit